MYEKDPVMLEILNQCMESKSGFVEAKTNKEGMTIKKDGNTIKKKWLQIFKQTQPKTERGNDV